MKMETVKAGGTDVVPARAFSQNAGRPLFAAFAAPSGLLGRLAGRLMAGKNTALNVFCLDLLDPKPGEHVLEIGYGPGKALSLLAERVGETGFVGGVDVSDLMFKAALRRNKAYVRDGRMRLALGAAHEEVWPDAAFDMALSVSNVQFWNPASVSLAETRRALKPGGRLALGVHLQNENAKRMTPGLYPEEVARLREMLVEAGFSSISEHPMDNGFDACLTAVKEGGQRRLRREPTDGEREFSPDRD